jgi:hypothetical protein
MTRLRLQAQASSTGVSYTRSGLGSPAQQPPLQAASPRAVASRTVSMEPTTSGEDDRSGLVVRRTASQLSYHTLNGRRVPRPQLGRQVDDTIGEGSEGAPALSAAHQQQQQQASAQRPGAAPLRVASRTASTVSDNLAVRPDRTINVPDTIVLEVAETVGVSDV